MTTWWRMTPEHEAAIRVRAAEFLAERPDQPEWSSRRRGEAYFTAAYDRRTLLHALDAARAELEHAGHRIDGPHGCWEMRCRDLASDLAAPWPENARLVAIEAAVRRYLTAQEHRHAEPHDTLVLGECSRCAGTEYGAEAELRAALGERRAESFGDGWYSEGV